MASTARQLAAKFAIRFGTGILLWTAFDALMTGDTFTLQATIIGLCCALVAHLSFRTTRKTTPTPEGR